MPMYTNRLKNPEISIGALAGSSPKKKYTSQRNGGFPYTNYELIFGMPKVKPLRSS